MVKKRKGQKPKEIFTQKIKLKPSIDVIAGQIIISDQIEQPKESLLTERLAEFLYMKYDRTKSTSNWNKETEQTKSVWINDAESIRQLVDEYYEE